MGVLKLTISNMENKIAMLLKEKEILEKEKKELGKKEKELLKKEKRIAELERKEISDASSKPTPPGKVRARNSAKARATANQW